MQMLEKITCHPNLHVGKFTYGIGCEFKSDAWVDITGNVTFGNYCYVGSKVRIYTHYHEFPLLKEPLLKQPKDSLVKYLDKVIEDDVWINYNATILSKVTHIPRGTIIGACSVLTKNPTEPNCIWAGNPARFIRKRV